MGLPPRSRKIDRVADWGLYLINRDMVVLSPLSHAYPVCSDSTATYRKSEKKKIYICMAYVFLRDFLAMHQGVVYRERFEDVEVPTDFELLIVNAHSIFYLSS